MNPPDYKHQQYGPGPVNPSQVIVTTGHISTIPKPMWSWCTLVTGMIGACCCPLFGWIATVMGILSYVDHKSADYSRSASKKRCSLGFGIAAIVIGSIIITAYIIMWSLLLREARVY